jgi:tetratricopeptide (TPR) repeat protein
VNRERLLFVGVLAILALWFFAMAEPPKFKEEAEPGAEKISIHPVRSPAYSSRPLPEVGDDESAFKDWTNERAHARPKLPITAARDLPNIWPPTSRSLSLLRLGLLRHPAARPLEGEATIELPELEEAAAGDETARVEDRVDQWTSFNLDKTGKVLALKLDGETVREPDELPPAGTLGDYYRHLVYLEMDPARAQEEGVSAVQVRFGDVRGSVWQTFPDEITDFKIALEGKQQGWFLGAKAYAKLPAKGYEARVTAGNRLLERGVNSGDKHTLEWSLHILGEARKMMPAAVQEARREILLSMLEAARKLNRQELVLELGFEHLSRYPKEGLVLEYVGNILASRSYGLDELALDFYSRAYTSKNAQIRRAALLIKLGRFGEARELLESGACGSGAEVDLLVARAALAQADFATAVDRGGGLTDGENAAEAYQILGGVAYAKGNAAEAQEHFFNAVTADPRRSTAYSDLGLALAVQGQAPDAMACFMRAAKLDFENTVIPKAGEAYMRLNVRDDPDTKESDEAVTALADAAAILDKLAEDNPRDLLVRFFRAYAKERSGELDTAAADYRSILDDNHRYRIAIARLGLVQARRIEEGADGDLQRPAVAHLRKAVVLNPDDPVLPYILGRFLMHEGVFPNEADALLQKAQEAKAPSNDPNLPLWARAARAALAYRDQSKEELAVKSMFNRVIEEVKDQVTATGEQEVQRAVERHPVYVYARSCLDEVSETERKVDVTWTFGTWPKEWDKIAKLPMGVGVVRGKGIHFSGTVNFQGQERDYHNILKYCAAKYESKNLTGSDFYELLVKGTIPSGSPVDVGIGIVGAGSSKRQGPKGIQIRRKARKQRPEVRLDGGDSDLFKKDKARNFIDITSMEWPAGPFSVRIELADREKGRIRLFLNDKNVFEAQVGTETERCVTFGRGRSSRGVLIYIWIEGNDGDKFGQIYVNSVRLTKAGS